MTDAQREEILRGVFTVHVPNFKKWNPDTRWRRDWFALAVDWYHDPKIIHLTLAQRAVWIQLVSMMGSRRGHLTCTTCSRVGHSMVTRGSDVYHSLLKLWKSGLVEIERVAIHDMTDKTRQTNKKKIASAPPPQPQQNVLPELQPKPPAPKKDHDTQAAIASWVDAYRERHGCSPPLGGKQRGQIRTLVRDYGLEKARMLMQAYLQMDDKVFVDSCHPLDLLLMRITRISKALSTGQKDPALGDVWGEVERLIAKQGGGNALR